MTEYNSFLYMTKVRFSRNTIGEKTTMSNLGDIQIADLHPKYLDRNNRWNDWYFVVNFMHEGREYLLTMIIAEGTSMGGTAFRIFLSSDPFTPKKEGGINVLDPPTQEIAINKQLNLDTFKFNDKGDSIEVELDELLITCTEKEMSIISKNEKISGKLIAKPRGPLLWWGNERNKECRITKGSELGGMEMLSNITGEINVNGKKIPVNGTGLFERLSIKSLDFFSIRFEDWIYANFDQMYTFLCHVESETKEGQSEHYETGTIYLMDEDDYIKTNKIKFTPSNWVFLKEAYRFFPLNQKIKVETDKGILKMKCTYTLYPQLIGKPMRAENLTMNRITGWNMLFYDLPFIIEGKFTYNDGKKIKLTNGRGLNNVVRVFPLY